MRLSERRDTRGLYALPSEYGNERAPQNVRVKDEIFPFDIRSLIAHGSSFVLRPPLTAQYLFWTGETGWDEEAPFVTGKHLDVKPGELHALRPWSNEAHLAPNDVPELRQFVEMSSTKPVTQSRHSQISRTDNLERATRIMDHRPKFVENEWSGMIPNSLLTKNDWSRRTAPDSNSDDTQ